MLNLLPLLIDEPDLPKEARDLLLGASWLRHSAVAQRARAHAANILGRRFALSREELAELLGPIDFP
jgi:hypothetical protein